MAKTKDMNGEIDYETWRDSHPIRIWIKGKDITLSALAGRMGISPQTLNDWLRGGGRSILERETRPLDDRVVKLCKLMKTTPESLRNALSAWRDAGERLSL